DAANARVDAVGQREVDDTELAAKVERRLGAPVGQLVQARATSAGEDQGIGVTGQFAHKSRAAVDHGVVPVFIDAWGEGFSCSCQMSRAYSRMVRSLEKRPLEAVLRMLMVVQCSTSR